MKEQARCAWVKEGDDLMTAYHDTEWGVPLYDDDSIFEFLVLESFQAGLSWNIVLRKRKNFEKVFANFDPVKVAKFSKKDVTSLLKNAGIIRNRAKIEAAINNAQKFLDVKREFKSFSRYMWGFVHDKTIVHSIRKVGDTPTSIPEAILWTKDLKRRGFKFLGPTTIYAHMQATGMVNDHLVTCFRKRSV